VNRYEQEHREATKTAGAVTLDRWSTVRVLGGDCASFLHNMCTNDIHGLSAGGGCEAFFTDVKGKIVAHALVLAGEDATQVLMVPDSAERLIAHLDRYIIREDVQLADVSAQQSWTLIVGEKADDAMGRLAPSIHPSPASDLSAPWRHVRANLQAIGTTESQLVRCEIPWCGGYLAACESDRADDLRGKLADCGAPSLPEAVWHAIRIESAWPLWGVDFDSSNLPQEINRDATALHFRKGCYLGQETVARIDALGHVNKKLVQVRFAGDAVPEVGDVLTLGDQQVGRVTSACWSPEFQAPLALAMVRRGANEPGMAVQWEGVPAEIVEPPTAPTAA
jgi:folate-binding protein YgfZ